MIHADKMAAAAAVSKADTGQQKPSQQLVSEAKKTNEVYLNKLNKSKKAETKTSEVPALKTFQEEVNKLKPKLDDKLSKLINKTGDDKVSHTNHRPYE